MRARNKIGIGSAIGASAAVAAGGVYLRYRHDLKKKRLALEAKAATEEREKITALIGDLLPLSARVGGIRNDTATQVAESRLGEVKAPTLIITAEDDLYHTLPGAQYTADHIPGAELKVFPTGGHLLVSHGADTQMAIGDFLRSRLGLAHWGEARAREQTSTAAMAAH